MWWFGETYTFNPVQARVVEVLWVEWERCRGGLAKSTLVGVAEEQSTFEREATRIDQEIAFTESDLHDARLEELDVEGVLAFAEYVLTDAARLWIEAPLEQKQRLQQVIFPHGVTYSLKRGFGTAETSVIFRLLQAVPSGKAGEVSPTGFEPVLPA